MKAATRTRSLKHKSLHDKLQLGADSQSQPHFKISKIQAAEKGNRADHKANMKHQGALKVEHLFLQFQHEESLCHHDNLAAQCTHELKMLNKQIELEHVRVGGLMNNINNIDPTFC